MTTELPELRIIDAETWEAAQGRRTVAGCVHLTHRRRPKRLLSGLLTCGLCGGKYIVRTATDVACSGRMNTGTCDDSREVAMSEIEERVLAAIRQHLLSPEPSRLPSKLIGPSTNVSRVSKQGLRPRAVVNFLRRRSASRTSSPLSRSRGSRRTPLTVGEFKNGAGPRSRRKCNQSTRERW